MGSPYIKKKTILLVDDEVITASRVAAQLGKEGYAVIQSRSGEDAVRIVESDRDRIDLILMSIDPGSGIDGPGAA